MDVPHSRAVLKKPPALQVAVPTMVPLFVAVFGTEVTMVTSCAMRAFCFGAGRASVSNPRNSLD